MVRYQLKLIPIEWKRKYKDKNIKRGGRWWRVAHGGSMSRARIQ